MLVYIVRLAGRTGKLGGCLLISSLPGKALRIFVGILSLAETLGGCLSTQFTRQGFENVCWYRQAFRDEANTSWVSFDIKFTRQGFEDVC